MLPKRLHLPLPHGAHDQALCLALPISTAQKQTKISGHLVRMSPVNTGQSSKTTASALRGPFGQQRTSLSPANGALGAGEAKATRDGLHASNQPPTWMRDPWKQGKEDDQEKEENNGGRRSS